MVGHASMGIRDGISLGDRPRREAEKKGERGLLTIDAKFLHGKED